MIRFLALGALGYAGYKYFRDHSNESTRSDHALPSDALAGGPLSDKATVQSTPELPADPV